MSERVDRREIMMNDFEYFFKKIHSMPGEEDPDIREEDYGIIMAAAANMVVANETRKMNNTIYHGIRDIINEMSPGTQRV